MPDDSDDSRSFRFLGLDFHPLTLAHRPLLEPLLLRHPQPLAGFSFASLACWSGAYRYAFHADADGRFLLLTAVLPESHQRHLLQPVGCVDSDALERLTDAARALPYPLRILGCGEAFLGAHSQFAAAFTAVPSRDMANYVYAADDLAGLRGKRFSKKRNLIAQAKKSYAWQTAPLDESQMAECARLVRQIADEDHAEGRDESWRMEMDALEFALAHFGELPQQGTAIRIDGELAAFALWEPSGGGMAIVHFERALRRFKGLYQVVNQETARAIRQAGFTLINREEDVGNPGLRQAKESYFPLRLQPSITLTLKPAPRM